MNIHQLHKNSIIIDAHEDISYQILKNNLDFANDKKISTQVSLPHLKSASVNLIFGAIFLDDKKNMRHANEHLKTYKNLSKKHRFKIIKKSEDIETLPLPSGIGFIIHLEGAEPIKNTKDLKNLYSSGLRSMSLTWKNENYLAGGNLSNNGLTKFGKKILQLAQKLNIIIDLAHLNEKSFYQVLQYTKGPIIVSHSNCKKLCDYNDRNLSDKQIYDIAMRKGVIGINMYNKMLSPDARANIKLVCNHIDHIKNIIGIDHVGLGTDFAGIKPKRTPKNLSNIGELKNLTRELKNRKYSDIEIQKILGLNFLRIIKQII